MRAELQAVAQEPLQGDGALPGQGLQEVILLDDARQELLMPLEAVRQRRGWSWRFAWVENLQVARSAI
jgi:hypothetical protein